MKILDTTGYSVFETWPEWSWCLIVAVFLTTFIIFMMAVHDINKDLIDHLICTVLGICAAVIVSLMLFYTLNSFTDSSTVKQMEVYVEDGYKFDAGFLEKWGIKKQITDNVYILERRRFDGR